MSMHANPLRQVCANVDIRGVLTDDSAGCNTNTGWETVHRRQKQFRILRD